MGVSSSRRVIVGKQGWLFYIGDDADPEYSPPGPLTKTQLAGWDHLLGARQTWPAARGIPYLFVFAPNKESIYREFLPASKPSAYHAAWTDQVIQYVQQHSGVKILDLRPALRQARLREQVYPKTESHWNKLGAFIAYQQIMEAIRQKYPHLRADSLSNYQVEQVSVPGGDLARFLGLQNDLWDTSYLIVPHAAPLIRTISGDPPTGQTSDLHYSALWVSECSTGDIPKLLFFHDSFGMAIRSLFAQRAKCAVQSWKGDLMDRALVERERPTVVIQVMVERKFGEKPPAQ